MPLSYAEGLYKFTYLYQTAQILNIDESLESSVKLKVLYLNGYMCDLCATEHSTLYMYFFKC